MTARKTRVTAGPEAQESAILAAAAEEFTKVGVRQANMDTIAKLADVSRSTLYRRFPSKDNLLIALANVTFERGMSLLEQSVEGLGPRDAVVEAFACGAALVNDDPLLRRMVLEDYEIRAVTASMSALFIDMVTGRVSKTLRTAGATMPDEDLRQVVEIHVRLVISFLEVPDEDPERRTPEYVRGYAAKYLAPMVH
ncbi:MAG: helix-turn-helix domain-containing protein [Gordonia sp. (in: high G+C Gram-positive bacteria)]